MGWVVNATPRLLYPRERPGTHCIGGWVSHRADLDGCENLAPPPPGFDPRTAVVHIGILSKPVHNLPFIILHRRHTLILQAG